MLVSSITANPLIKSDQTTPIFVDNVLPIMKSWRDQGQKTTLVTFINREGTAPRPIGAQMAISQTGQSVGYIASDCLGQAIIQEALDVIKTNSARAVRYGKGSKYMDLKLPCGSGIDLYFDGHLSDENLNQLLENQTKRTPSTLTINIEHGTSNLQPWSKEIKTGFDQKDPNHFHRSYFPQPRLYIAGSGPGVSYLAQFAHQAGFAVALSTNDQALHDHLTNKHMRISSLSQAPQLINDFVDDATACVIMFHDHDQETSLFIELLKKSPFYLGAMGSKNAHEIRQMTLQSYGISTREIARINGPIGAIPTSKSPPQIAISILAEVIQEAQQRELLC